jgi:UDP-N-acetylglucosamine 2-epimerase (non-hydrolysing)
MNTITHKVCIILGTRPELIKMAPIIRACEKRNLDYFVIHTGQHYSYEMDEIFINELDLTAPKYNLAVGSGTHGKQTARMMEGIEEILIEEKPTVVLVQGDTNSVLAGALVASKMRIQLGHIEAGLRSFDREMPEEINRIIADHIADFLFAPTEAGKQHLLQEGITQDKIIITGNTIVDLVLQNTQLASERSSVLTDNGYLSKQFILLTIHRAENTDNKEHLTHILDGINLVTKQVDIPILWPMHPRTKSMIELFKLGDKLAKIANLKIIEPVGFLDFIHLERHARLAITDSGGVQEETCILGTPCVTLRTSTERPETVKVGSNIIAGRIPEVILSSVLTMLEFANKWDNPFGDGSASIRIIDSILATKTKIYSKKMNQIYSERNTGVLSNKGD